MIHHRRALAVDRFTPSLSSLGTIRHFVQGERLSQVCALSGVVLRKESRGDADARVAPLRVCERCRKLRIGI